MRAIRRRLRRIRACLAPALATDVAGAAAQVTYQVDGTLDPIDDDLSDGGCQIGAHEAGILLVDSFESGDLSAWSL